MSIPNILKTVLILLLLTPQFASGLTVNFLEKVSVKSNEIFLRDIVEFDKEDEFSKALGTQKICDSAEPGQYITLNSKQIEQYLTRTYGLTTDIMWGGTKSITVLTDSNIINPTDIQKLIMEFIANNKHKLPAAEVTFIPNKLPLPFHLPAGELTHQIIPSNPAILGSTAITIILKIDNRVRKNFSVRGKMQALAKVTVANVPIRRGDILSADQLSLQIRNIANLTVPGTNVSNLIGKTITRNIQTGDIIKITDVTLPPVIHRGELVKIVLNTGALHLTASGIAKMDGRIDDTIRVRNTSSNKMLHCRVSGPGTVEVTY